MTELLWAPYTEFGIPDRSLETREPPAFPVMVRATGYREQERIVVIYWEKG